MTHQQHLDCPSKVCWAPNSAIVNILCRSICSMVQRTSIVQISEANASKAARSLLLMAHHVNSIDPPDASCAALPDQCSSGVHWHSYLVCGPQQNQLHLLSSIEALV